MSHDCISQRKDVWTGVGTTLENRQIADSTWKISIEAPEFAARVESGKFVMLRLAAGDDPLLGRPFAIYDADKTSGRVEVVYAVVGKAEGIGLALYNRMLKASAYTVIYI